MIREALAERLIVQPADASAMIFHQASLGQDERSRADPDQRNLRSGGSLQVADCLAIDRKFIVQQPAHDHDIVELARVHEIRSRRDLDAATGGDQVSAACQHVPVGQNPAGPVGLVACQSERVDEQRERRKCEGTSQYKADLQSAEPGRFFC